MATLPLHRKTLDFLARPQRMLIGDQWLDAASGSRMQVRNPATGEPLASVPSASAEDVDRAVQAARSAFYDSAWNRIRPRERQNLLWRLAELIERDADVLAELECLNNGKSAQVARAMDVQLCIDFLRYMAGWATKIEGSTVEPSLPLMPNEDFHAYIRREAVGVVGAIVAWNFPLLLACWKLGPALASGCTLVLKPADETPLSALKLAELVQEAGYPAGVFNVVTGTGLNAGAALSSHPGVDKLTFTGSTEVGKQIGKAAMDNMTRVTLELGGKSPTIVLADADLQQAAAGAASAIFFNQGQVCCAGSRLYVQRKHFDNVVADIAAIANGMKLGNGLDPSVQMGPLISAKQQDRVTGYINLGRELGATVACGGEGFGPGYFVQPTVLVDVDQRHRLVQEEIFGPVLVAMPFDDIDEVVRLANDNPYGLGASIWSNDLKLYGQEVNLLTSAIARMNMFLHEIEEFEVLRGDTLAEPKFIEGDQLKQFDVIFANPPYSIKKWNRDKFSADPYGRNLYGTPPQGCADYGFYTHIIKSLKPDTGRAAMLWPHGVLFRDSEQAIRKQVIESDIIEAVIGLGPNLFYNSPMESCVVVLNCNKPAERRGKILFINGVEHVTRERAHSRLSDDDLVVLTEAYLAPDKYPAISALVNVEEIRENQHNLSIPLYVRAVDDEEVHDIEHAIEAWKVSRVKLKKQADKLFKSLAELGEARVK